MKQRISIHTNKATRPPPKEKIKPVARGITKIRTYLVSLAHGFDRVKWMEKKSNRRARDAAGDSGYYCTRRCIRMMRQTAISWGTAVLAWKSWFVLR